MRLRECPTLKGNTLLGIVTWSVLGKQKRSICQFRLKTTSFTFLSFFFLFFFFVCLRKNVLVTTTIMLCMEDILHEEDVLMILVDKVKYDRPGECSPEKDCLR